MLVVGDWIHVIDAFLKFYLPVELSYTAYYFADDLIVDPRNLEWIREANCPVVSQTCLVPSRF